VQLGVLWRVVGRMLHSARLMTTVRRSRVSVRALLGGLALVAAGVPALAQPPLPVPVRGLGTPAKSAVASASPSAAAGAGIAGASSATLHAPVSIPAGRCNEQPPQPFLIRSSWFNHGAAGTQLFQQSVRYRTEKYGYFSGFGKPEWNAHAPGHYAVATTFLGLPITVNQRVVPALHCAEKALEQSGALAGYRPRGIGGIRFHNTYHGGEVSNHVYGIAMDMDSEANTCCGCVGHWAKHPLCQKKVSSVYERTKVTRAWVETMERFGWYWLGNDVLEDTMHFEFLGDPDKILSPMATAAAASSSSSASTHAVGPSTN
jgi:hypothetical protein